MQPDANKREVFVNILSENIKDYMKADATSGALITGTTPSLNEKDKNPEVQ